MFVQRPYFLDIHTDILMVGKCWDVWKLLPWWVGSEEDNKLVSREFDDSSGWARGIREFIGLFSLLVCMFEIFHNKKCFFQDSFLCLTSPYLFFFLIGTISPVLLKLGKAMLSKLSLSPWQEIQKCLPLLDKIFILSPFVRPL